MRTNRWFRGGFAVLALLVLVGLVFVACHKKEGAEQSRVAPQAPAVAPNPAVEQALAAAPVSIPAAPIAPAPAAKSPQTPKAPVTIAA